MKRAQFVIGLSIFLLIIGGCAKNEAGIGDNDQALEGSTEMDATNTRSSEEQKNTQFGYVRYNKGQINVNNAKNTAPDIDREEIANLITKTLISTTHIEEAATLVTDSHALVAYTPREDVDRNLAADTVKKTAQGILPRWYHVYISDQPNAYLDLQSLSNNSVNESGTRPALESVIDRFTRESPQGGNYSEKDHMLKNGQ